jgi:putative membrane protein
MKMVVVLIGAALLGALPAAVAAQKDQSSQDQAFVNAAARGGLMEVELGQLAQKNGSSSEVKQFGARMVTDHTRLNTKLGAAAKSVGLTVPSSISAEQKAEYDKLANLSGSQFDKAYIDLMVKAHTSDLAAFQKEDEATQNATLKAAVSGAIPVVEDHLKMAKSDSTKLGPR